MLEDFEHRFRAVRGRDAFHPSDLGVRKAVIRLGPAGDRHSVAAVAERWRRWRLRHAAPVGQPW